MPTITLEEFKKEYPEMQQLKTVFNEKIVEALYGLAYKYYRLGCLEQGKKGE